MRSIKQFTTDLIKKPPMIFPFIGGFHLIMLVWTIATSDSAIPGDNALRISWMAAFTICWLAMCDLRKWAAWAYMGLVAIDLACYFLIKSVYDRDHYASALFPMNVVFCLFILLYFKRFAGKKTV